MNLSRKAFLRVSCFSLLGAAMRKTAAAFGSTFSRKVQWGMAVDIRKCARRPECTACIDVCDQAHNVPRVPDKRHEVRWIWKDTPEHAFEGEDFRYSSIAKLPVMLMCNHCDDPPCVRVCPTQATWKREDGIVAMDWHRCIGCRYCMAACPYESRSFNWVDPRPYIKTANPEFPTRTKGVVEKCTFCVERISQGREPACVEACPEKALIFGNVMDANSEIRRMLSSRDHVTRKPELGTGPNVFYLL